MPSYAESWPRLPGWVVEEELASGGQAHAYAVRREGEPTGNRFVAKVYRAVLPDGRHVSLGRRRARLRRELQVLRTLEAARCPHIVRIVSYHFGENDEPMWYVMPDYVGGPMCKRDERGRILRWAEPYRGRLGRVLEIAGVLAETLTCMHAHDPPCIHRDLHSGNVLFWKRGGGPVLSDFATATLGEGTEHAAPREASGPQFWRPPEFDRSPPVASPASDVFMLGGLIYEAVSGGWQPHASGEAASTWPPDCDLSRYTEDPASPAASALLERMLARAPAERPSAAEVRAACAHLRAGRG